VQTAKRAWSDARAVQICDPQVVGQPFRIRALDDLIAYAKWCDDVLFATGEEIAECDLKNRHSRIA
jgi:hypothetical protein